VAKKRVKVFGKFCSVSEPMSLEKAEKLIGGPKKLFTIKDYIKVFSRSLDESVVKRYEKVPFSEAELIQAHKWGMILVAIPSMISIEMLIAANGDNYLWVAESLKTNDSFFNIKTRQGGYMLLFPEVFGTKNMSFPEQMKFIPKTLESPLAIEMAYVDLLVAAKYGKKASRKRLRCFDELHSGKHVTVRIATDTFKVKIEEAEDTEKSWDLALAGGYFRPTFIE